MISIVNRQKIDRYICSDSNRFSCSRNRNEILEVKTKSQLQICLKSKSKILISHCPQFKTPKDLISFIVEKQNASVFIYLFFCISELIFFSSFTLIFLFALFAYDFALFLIIFYQIWSPDHRLKDQRLRIVECFL